MRIYFDDKGDLDGLKSLLGRAVFDGARGLAVLACEENGFTAEGLEPLLKAAGAPLTGGVFPAVIYGGRAHRRGTVVLGFPGRVGSVTIKDFSSPSTNMEAPLEELSARCPWARTMAVFTDGFSGCTTQFTNRLFDIFGLGINYVGGGAASLKPGAAASLFCNEGLIKDAAVLLALEIPSGVGVSHGWQPIGQPMQATETEGNIIRTIDFRPAFDVYREAVAAASGVTFGKEDFLMVTRGYPFGIARINMEMIVRDPLKVEADGSLVCAGEVPQDSYIFVMNGDEASLTEAAGKAGSMAAAALSGPSAGTGIIIDCISRLMFLGDNFPREVSRMSPAGMQCAGACTVGEIANSGAEFLEFYNKTAVVAAMGKI